MARTPIHPGEHLAEELRELGMTAAELSRQIDVPVNRITGIIHGQPFDQGGTEEHRLPLYQEDIGAQNPRQSQEPPEDCQ